MRALLLLAFSSLLLGQRGAMETSSRMSYPEVWPEGPARSSVPAWAAPGKIRFARWDGGRLETSKAMLSGWPGFNPPVPDLVDTMTNWYSPRTIELLKEGGINTIWVTFSVGFSNPTERGNREQLRQYIAECHRQGIHVLAYQSIANLFWEDMFENVPESRNWVRTGSDGKPTPYSAGAYQKVGRITRYMARLAEPAWRAYLRERVDLALDAGADGIFYDNNFHEHLLETYREIYSHGSSRKNDMLLAGNFHADTYLLNRVTNALSTEDGMEPGIYSAANLQGRAAKSRASLLPLEGGVLVNNLGLYRIYQSLTEGWKPAFIEDGSRETGERFTRPIPAARHQVALAEGMMFGIAMQVFSEGTFANGLMRGHPDAMEIWRAIGRYNRFFAANESLYAPGKSMAQVAVVLDDRSEGYELLNSLAARNVLFDVIYDIDLTPARLASYAAVVAASSSYRPRTRPLLEGYRGKLLRTIDASLLDEIAATLRAFRPPVGLDAPAGVVYNPVTQSGRLLIHLLNYSTQAKDKIALQVPPGYRTVALLSPDDTREPAVLQGTVVKVPQLKTYSVLVLTR
jgi:hypothetical protein